MAGFDLPFPTDEAEPLASERQDALSGAKARAKALSGEPMAWLAAATAVFFAFDAGLHSACSSASEGLCGAPRLGVFTLVVLAAILVLGLSLREAFGRYLFRRTQILAALVAALPLAHLLATDHNSPVVVAEGPPGELPYIDELEAALAASEADRQTLSFRVAALQTQMDQQQRTLDAMPAPMAVTEVEEIAAAKAAEVLSQEDQAIEEILEEQEARVISELEDRARRDEALKTVGERIAGAGPLLRPDAAEPVALSQEMAEVANKLRLDERARAELALNEARQTCISTRLADRGPLAAMNQRLNPERYADYLASCFD